MQPFRISRRSGERPRYPTPAPALLHPADVLAGAGIDLDDFVLVDEQRDPDGRAGLELGRLAAAARSVAAQAGIGFDDLEFHEVRWRDRQRNAVPERDDALFF